MRQECAKPELRGVPGVRQVCARCAPGVRQVCARCAPGAGRQAAGHMRRRKTPNLPQTRPQTGSDPRMFPMNYPAN